MSRQDVKIYSLRRLPNGTLRTYSGPGVTLDDKIKMLEEELANLKTKKAQSQ